MDSIVRDCLRSIEAVRKQFVGQPDQIRLRYRHLTQEMLDKFVKLLPIERRKLIQSLSWNDSALLLGIARSGATSSVEEKNRRLLHWGMLALLVEDGRCDLRETLIELTLLDNSAQKLGIDLNDVYQSHMNFASDKMKELVESYFTDGNRSLLAMGYIEATDAKGRFTYKQSW